MRIILLSVLLIFASCSVDEDLIEEWCEPEMEHIVDEEDETIQTDTQTSTTVVVGEPIASAKCADLEFRSMEGLIPRKKTAEELEILVEVLGGFGGPNPGLIYYGMNVRVYGDVWLEEYLKNNDSLYTAIQYKADGEWLYLPGPNPWRKIRVDRFDEIRQQFDDLGIAIPEDLGEYYEISWTSSSLDIENDMFANTDLRFVFRNESCDQTIYSEPATFVNGVAVDLPQIEQELQVPPKDD